MQYVIVGAGPAGVIAAETLRKTDPGGSVVLVDGEAGAPYARMAIPYYLSGGIEEKGTHLRQNDGHYEELGIDCRQARVARLSTAKGRLELEGGGSLDYDRLLIATGSRPAAPPVEGLDNPGVHACWTLEDARNIIKLAKSGSDVVLLGAGFVACIIMQALVSRGVNLTVVAGPSGRMVRSMMDETAGGMIRKWCQAKGVKIVVGRRLKAVAAGPVVELDNGEALKADLVVVATGVKANTEFVEGDGIDTDDGILVDQYLRTSADNVYAAGDIAQGIDFSTGARTVHAIQPTAVDHGRIAALNMAGAEAPFKGSLAMNVLATIGLISTSFGRWGGVEGGESSTMVDDAGYAYMHLEFEDDRLIGACCVGRTDHVGAIRGLIGTRIPLGAWKGRLKDDPNRFMEAYVACTQV